MDGNLRLTIEQTDQQVQNSFFSSQNQGKTLRQKQIYALFYMIEKVYLRKRYLRKEVTEAYCVRKQRSVCSS